VNKDQLRINIRIEGRVYPLNIERVDEERHRLAAKTVNEMVNKYRELFRNKDPQDILAMAAFQIALDHNELIQHVKSNNLTEELRNINDDIADFIEEKRVK
jgi:cell division protein ZapA (FtsZ GTPase activity inhibitor)